MDDSLQNKIDAATGTSELEINFTPSSSSSSTLRNSFLTPDETTTLSYELVTTISTEVQTDKEKFLKTEEISKPHNEFDAVINTSSISSLNKTIFPTERSKEEAVSTDILSTNLTGSGESLVSSTAKKEILENVSETDSLKQFQSELERKGEIDIEVDQEHQILSPAKVLVQTDSLSSEVPVSVNNLASDISSFETNKRKVSISTTKDTNLRFAEESEEPLLKSSKSKHVRKVTSSEEEEEEKEAPSLLKSSKSHHVKKATTPQDDDSDDSDDIENTNLQMGHVFVYMVIPPDGGFGWFVTFISFLCQVVVDGIIFSIGIVLPHIAKDLNIPGSKVVLVASMQVGFYFLSGTVSSAFINKFGFRPVALVGCLLSIIVLTIASFSVNLPMMIFFYSILGGPALSMIWVSSQLIIGYYFDKYRPIANGASCSGAGAGIMLFSYMNSNLVTAVGWRNLMRVHVGFLIVVLIMTLSFIEVAPTRIGRVKETLAEDTESESFDLLTGLTQYSRFSLKVDNQEYSLDDNFESLMEKSKDTKPEKSSSSWQKYCPCFQNYCQQRQEQKTQQAAIRRYVIKQDLIERQDLFYMGPKDHKKEEEQQYEALQKRSSQRTSLSLDPNQCRSISLEDFDNKHKRLTIINTLSTMHMPQDQQLQKEHQTYKELKETEKHPLLAFLSPKNLIHPKIRKAFSLLFDFRLLAIMEFRILLLSAFLFPMGFNIPFVYSTVRVQIDASFAKLISPTIGFSNFAFRIASGFVAYKFREYTTYICGGGMFFGGIAVLVSAFYGLDVVWFQFVYAMCYGIAPAFYSTLRAIIYVRSLGLDKLTNAFGLTTLAMGMGVFIGTTAGGILNDFTGSYKASFIFAGICICASGALKLVLPYLIKLSQDKDVRK